jgi:hypothetical protein
MRSLWFVFVLACKGPSGAPAKTVAPAPAPVAECSTDADCSAVPSRDLGNCCPWQCGAVVVTAAFAQTYQTSVAHCAPDRQCVENDCDSEPPRVIPVCAGQRCVNRCGAFRGDVVDDQCR